jgi:peptidyl-tRNA hydrolase
VIAVNRYVRDDEEPWALNLVVRVEKDQLPQHTDLLEAAARATVLLLNDERASTIWLDAIARWHDGRIRKLCRRARGAKWAATDELDHVELTAGTAVVRAFVPCAVDAQPEQLRRLQLAGTNFTDIAPPGLASTDLVVWLNPSIAMSSAKAAVQAAHAAQLVVERWKAARPLDVAAWLAHGAPLSVRSADEVLWKFLVETTDFHQQETFYVQVHDAGFTEIPAGSLTAIGLLVT